MRKRLIALSDSHGHNIELERAIKQAGKEGKIDAVVFLGDGVQEFNDIRHILDREHILVYVVTGNNDFGSYEPQEVSFKLGGIDVFATHGHKQYVKYGLDRLYYTAAEKDAILVLYGHTHEAKTEVIRSMYMICPGAIGRSCPTYADIIIEDNGLVSPRIVSLRT